MAYLRVGWWRLVWHVCRLQRAMRARIQKIALIISFVSCRPIDVGNMRRRPEAACTRHHWRDTLRRFWPPTINLHRAQCGDGPSQHIRSNTHTHTHARTPADWIDSLASYTNLICLLFAFSREPFDHFANAYGEQQMANSSQ